MNTAIQKRRDEVIDPLHSSYLNVIAEVRATETAKPQPASKHAHKELSRAILDINSLVRRTDDSFAKLTFQASIKLESYRMFKWLRGGINRAAVIPNLENTIAALGGVACVEATLAGWVYALEGKMTFVQGLGYGAIFGFCNVTIALVIGWLLRHACITYHDQFNPKTVRGLAWIGITLFSSLLMVLIVSGARVRAFGRNTDIWNFSELGWFATFSDAYTLLFLAISIISTAYAVLKGSTALSDFIPDFTVAEKQVVALDEAGVELAEHYEEVIQQTCDAAIEEFEAVQGDPEEREAYCLRRDTVLELVEQHNLQVREGVTKLNDLSQEIVDVKTRNPSMVTELPHLMIDIEAVQKQLELPSIPPRSEDLIAKLEQETQLALASCKEALMAYLYADKSPDHDNENEGEVAHV